MTRSLQPGLADRAGDSTLPGAMKLRLVSACIRSTLVFSSAIVLHAQSLLFAEHDGHGRVVHDVVEDRAFVEVNGRLVRADGNQVVFRKAEEFCPVLVSVPRIEISSSYSELSGEQVDKALHVQAEFESAVALPRVFLAIELRATSTDNRVLIWQIGDLRPHERIRVKGANPWNVTRPVRPTTGSGASIEAYRKTSPEPHYVLHIFSNGLEAFNSQMAPEFVEESLDRMMARRIKDLADGSVRPFVGPEPLYPETLRAANTRGKAVVSFRVSTTGRVTDPAIVSASEPAFGDSALAAIRSWRFFPKIENGHPVESPAQMPFLFGLPEAKPKS